jgi:hypothetical protein
LSRGSDPDAGEGVLPKLRQRGIEVTVVERRVDAVDELLRVKPDAFFLDIEHPDFEKAHRTTAEKSPNLPIVLTGRSPSSAPANMAYAAFASRPYDTEELARIAQQAMSSPDGMLARQATQRTSAPRPISVASPSAPIRRPATLPRSEVVVATKPGSTKNTRCSASCAASRSAP